MDEQRVVVAVSLRTVNAAKLWREARAAWANIHSLTDLGAAIGFDFDVGAVSAPTQAAVDGLVAAHDPAPDPPTPAEIQIAADIQTAKDYGTSAQLDGFLNLVGDATPAQLTAAMKATIRMDRALARLLRRIYRELE